MNGILPHSQEREKMRLKPSNPANITNLWSYELYIGFGTILVEIMPRLSPYFCQVYIFQIISIIIPVEV